MTASTKWAEIFTTLGHDITVRSDGDLIFTDQVPFLVMVEPDDPTYLHVILTGICQAKSLSGEDGVRSLQIVNEINGTTKVAKLIYHPSGVFASGEAICPTTAAAMAIIPQILSHLQLAGFRFDQMKFASENAADHQLVLLR